MKKLLIALMTTVAGLSMAATAQAQEKLKACWVYVGPIGDFGYSYQHDQGRLDVEKAFGDKVETAYLENVAEGPDAERAFERLARENCKIIFGTSFGFMDPMVKVAKRFPDVKFEHATGYKTADNLAVYNARFYEGRYVMGQIAAKMSKKGLAGYIVSFPIPEVVMGINSFMLAPSRSTRISSSRSSGSIRGSTPARKLMRPRRCSTRALTSSPSTRTPPRRCRWPRSAVCSALASLRT